jgi:hypothetical protein
LEVVAEEFEGVLGGPESDAVAVAGECELLDLGVFTVGEGDVDEADGFLGVDTGGGCGAGDAGNAEGEGTAGAAADAFGEGAGYGVGDCAVLVEEEGGDVGEGGLAAVGVGDGAAEKDAGAVGDGGEAFCEEAAGAAFGDGEGVAADAEEEKDDLGERLVMGGEDFVGHLVLDELDELVDAGLSGCEGGLDAEEVELDFAGAGEDGGFDVGELGVDGGGAGVDLAFGDKGHAEDTAGEVAGWEGFGEAGFYFGVKEGFEFFGGAGEKDHELAEGPGFGIRGAREDGVEELAGSGAVGVGEEDGTLEDIGLTDVVGGHGDVAGGEAGLEGGEYGGVAVEGEVEDLGEALAGEVVFSGAEAAGEENDVGAAEGDADGAGEVAAVVADDGLEGDRDAEVVEAGGEVEGVGVLAMRGEHLGADGDDFGDHVWPLPPDDFW